MTSSGNKMNRKQTFYRNSLGCLRASKGLTCVCLLLTLLACSSIDEDLSDCGSDYELNYELRLVTNMTTELQTQLTTQTDVNIAQALRTHLQNIFTDFAHDVDLSFYDTQGDSLRLHHDEHIMDANQASYTLYLPMRQYMHLAAANVVNNNVVSIANDERCHTATLLSVQGDTIASHTTGIFTARQPMEVLEGVDQTFNVHLYMANCAATLVIDTIGSNLGALNVVSTGFATGFNMADSTFIYPSKSPIVVAEQIQTNTSDNGVAFCAVSFPSPEKPTTRTVIETTEPFISASSENSLWEFRVYATTAEGTITESRLYVNTPLRAGQLKIIKAKAKPDGSMGTNDQTVGVSVTLNWNNAGEYNPEL